MNSFIVVLDIKSPIFVGELRNFLMNQLEKFKYDIITDRPDMWNYVVTEKKEFSEEMKMKTAFSPVIKLPNPSPKTEILPIPDEEFEKLSEEDIHEMLGERIYNYICEIYPDVNPGKITGMILKTYKENYNALNRVINNGSIDLKIDEAIQVFNIDDQPPTEKSPMKKFFTKTLETQPLPKTEIPPKTLEMQTSETQISPKAEISPKTLEMQTSKKKSTKAVVRTPSPPKTPSSLKEETKINKSSYNIELEIARDLMGVSFKTSMHDQLDVSKNKK